MSKSSSCTSGPHCEYKGKVLEIKTATQILRNQSSFIAVMEKVLVVLDKRLK